MKQVEEPDPSYVRDVLEWDTTPSLFPGRRSSNPVISTHLWRGTIPTDLEAGKHTITVRATDRYGKVHSATSHYTLADPVD